MSVLTVDELRGRVDTDIDDIGLQAIIDTNEQEIVARYGPYRDPELPITEQILGCRRRISVARPVDPTEEITIVETVRTSDVTLDTTDYRLWGDRFIERLWTGNNPPQRWWGTGYRARWGEVVTVTFVPGDDTARRSEVALKLAMLTIEYKGVVMERVGDVETSYGASRSAGELVYTKEREGLLETLQPRGAVMIR